LKTSCNSVLFGNFSLETALKNIADSGYDGAELAALPGMASHVGIDTSESFLKEVAKMAEDRSLQLSSIEAGGVRDDFDAVLQTAASLGIPVVAIGSGGKMNDEEAFKEVVEGVAKAVERAETHGVKLAVKAHVHAAVYNSATCLRLLDEVDSKYVGINFDPSHIFRAGELPEEAAAKIGKGIIHSHFRDAPVAEMGPPGNPWEQIPGTGLIDLSATIKSLRDVGYEGYLSLEVIGGGGMAETELMAIASRSQGYVLRLLREAGVR
jgi:sugar phosphate isomerase/epimerase